MENAVSSIATAGAPRAARGCGRRCRGVAGAGIAAARGAGAGAAAAAALRLRRRLAALRPLLRACSAPAVAGSGGRFAAPLGRGRLEQQDQRPFGHLVALLEFDLRDSCRPTGAGTSIAAFSVSMVIKRRFFLDLLAVLDQHVDDADVLEAADIRNQNFSWIGHDRLDRQGIGFFRIDAETPAWPQSPSACRSCPRRPAP